MSLASLPIIPNVNTSLASQGQLIVSYTKVTGDITKLMSFLARGDNVI